jgi:hypothetical protein
MNQLFIKLTGTVNSSNFDIWKKQLITQIQAVNVELITDDDFVIASKQARSFKAAEKSLKEAKQSAINQAEEIQQLFTAIDEITEEARQARLSLERQIKTRKLEIKQQYIQSGIEEIQRFIDNQIIDKQIHAFKKCDLTPFLNRNRFESAVSGKAGIRGLEIGIEQICTQIKTEISEKAEKIQHNKIKLDALPEVYKILFQDAALLTCLPEDELEAEINKRTTRYNEEMARREAEESAREIENITIESITIENSETATKIDASVLQLNQNDNIEHTPTESIATQDQSQKIKKYQIIIDLLSTLDKAKKVAGIIKSEYANDSSVQLIKLIHHRDE